MDANKDKKDFDGTPGSISSPTSCEESACEVSGDTAVEGKEKELRLCRQGLFYRTMSADNTVFHESDASKLLAGAVIIKRLCRYAYEQVSRIVKYDYEVIRYKTSDGKIHEGYFPFNGAPEIVDVVSGTHASGNQLAYWVFNKYVHDTPFYREMHRISSGNMILSRMTLTNWLEKGSVHFKELISPLKNTCLEKDSIVNCDET